MRYPHSTEVCKNCQEQMAMFNDHYCGACAESMGLPERQDTCKSCGAPNGIYIQRSLAEPRYWIKCVGGADGEPGFGKSRKSMVLASGLCRYCEDKRRTPCSPTA